MSTPALRIAVDLVAQPGGKRGAVWSGVIVERVELPPLTARQRDRVVLREALRGSDYAAIQRALQRAHDARRGPALVRR